MSVLNRPKFALQETKEEVLLKPFLTSPPVENSIISWSLHLKWTLNTTSPHQPFSAHKQVQQGTYICVRKFYFTHSSSLLSALSLLCWVSSRPLGSWNLLQDQGLVVMKNQIHPATDRILYIPFHPAWVVSHQDVCLVSMIFTPVLIHRHSILFSLFLSSIQSKTLYICNRMYQIGRVGENFPLISWHNISIFLE